jgi:hypothetical protein
MVPEDVREALEAEFAALDFTQLGDIAEAHTILARYLVGGKLSPTVASEVRELIASATTLAAARAQGIFLTETVLDGTQAVGAAVEAARARREVTEQRTEELEDELEDTPYDVN